MDKSEKFGSLESYKKTYCLDFNMISGPFVIIKSDIILKGKFWEFFKLANTEEYPYKALFCISWSKSIEYYFICKLKDTKVAGELDFTDNKLTYSQGEICLQVGININLPSGNDKKENSKLIGCVKYDKVNKEIIIVAKLDSWKKPFGWNFELSNLQLSISKKLDELEWFNIGMRGEIKYDEFELHSLIKFTVGTPLRPYAVFIYIRNLDLLNIIEKILDTKILKNTEFLKDVIPKIEYFWLLHIIDTTKIKTTEFLSLEKGSLTIPEVKIPTDLRESKSHLKNIDKNTCTNYFVGPLLKVITRIQIYKLIIEALGEFNIEEKLLCVYGAVENFDFGIISLRGTDKNEKGFAYLEISPDKFECIVDVALIISKVFKLNVKGIVNNNRLQFDFHAKFLSLTFSFNLIYSSNDNFSLQALFQNTTMPNSDQEVNKFKEEILGSIEELTKDIKNSIEEMERDLSNVQKSGISCFFQRSWSKIKKTLKATLYISLKSVNWIYNIFKGLIEFSIDMISLQCEIKDQQHAKLELKYKFKIQIKPLEGFFNLLLPDDLPEISADSLGGCKKFISFITKLILSKLHNFLQKEEMCEMNKHPEYKRMEKIFNEYDQLVNDPSKISQNDQLWPESLKRFQCFSSSNISKVPTQNHDQKRGTNQNNNSNTKFSQQIEDTIKDNQETKKIPNYPKLIDKHHINDLIKNTQTFDPIPAPSKFDSQSELNKTQIEIKIPQINSTENKMPENTKVQKEKPGFPLSNNNMLNQRNKSKENNSIEKPIDASNQQEKKKENNSENDIRETNQLQPTKKKESNTESDTRERNQWQLIQKKESNTESDTKERNQWQLIQKKESNTESYTKERNQWQPIQKKENNTENDTKEIHQWQPTQKKESNTQNDTRERNQWQFIQKKENNTQYSIKEMYQLKAMQKRNDHLNIQLNGIEKVSGNLMKDMKLFNLRKFNEINPIITIRKSDEKYNLNGINLSKLLGIKPISVKIPDREKDGYKLKPFIAFSIVDDFVDKLFEDKKNEPKDMEKNKESDKIDTLTKILIFNPRIINLLNLLSVGAGNITSNILRKSSKVINHISLFQSSKCRIIFEIPDNNHYSWPKIRIIFIIFLVLMQLHCQIQVILSGDIAKYGGPYELKRFDNPMTFDELDEILHNCCRKTKTASKNLKSVNKSGFNVNLDFIIYFTHKENMLPLTKEAYEDLRSAFEPQNVNIGYVANINATNDTQFKYKLNNGKENIGEKCGLEEFLIELFQTLSNKKQFEHNLAKKANDLMLNEPIQKIDEILKYSKEIWSQNLKDKNKSQYIKVVYHSSSNYNLLSFKKDLQLPNQINIFENKDITQNDHIWQELSCKLDPIVDDIVNEFSIIPHNKWTKYSLSSRGKIIDIKGIIKWITSNKTSNDIFLEKKRGGIYSISVCLVINLNCIESSVLYTHMLPAVFAMINAYEKLKISTSCICLTDTILIIKECDGYMWNDKAKFNLLSAFYSPPKGDDKLPVNEIDAICYGLNLLNSDCSIRSQDPKYLFFITTELPKSKLNDIEEIVKLAASYGIEIWGYCPIGYGNFLESTGFYSYSLSSNFSYLPQIIKSIFSTCDLHQMSIENTNHETWEPQNDFDIDFDLTNLNILDTELNNYLSSCLDYASSKISSKSKNNLIEKHDPNSILLVESLNEENHGLKNLFNLCLKLELARLKLKLFNELLIELSGINNKDSSQT